MKPNTQMTIVLGTYNGAAFLREQLDSLVQQTFTEWDLLVTDDGSTDQTLDIVRAFSRENPDTEVTVISGPGLGVARNFLQAVRHENCRGKMMAFCDQDDVWLPHKLQAAVDGLARHPDGVPAINASAVRVVDQGLNVLRDTRPVSGDVSFGNLLVENTITGNTMVLNAAAVALVNFVPEVPFHDWWVLQLVSGVGGRIVCDPEPTVLYRQHALNVVGNTSGIAKKQSNLRAVFTRVYSGNVFKNVRALMDAKVALTPENQRILGAVQAVSGNRFRAFTLPAKRVRRRGILATVVMCFALFIGAGDEHE